MREPLGPELRPLHLPLQLVWGFVQQRLLCKALSSAEYHPGPPRAVLKATASGEPVQMYTLRSGGYLPPPVSGSPFLEVTLGFMRALPSRRSWSWEQLPQAVLSNSS